ncbi:MAG: cob(I)yrinic acid a,c-diamide adenosyltransferase [Kiritimatiellia bacterium]|jgi:cob(I)alamin adenosyltransferase|nr:cob(I)yrinic acid a,c-diamide adenosyltransferase [Kiritimatiellia bacterium]MDP6630481.1 cob(I)yrinic acid a,c-diamide adenosyltransferase [Kiritimatiellia bacterium]MDP6809938.1 cob(I)yrinic acid a,c-diamide adenosyltransferase [Kiritimatiellia bacterium]MDP7025028.1 cob(I)yrinic acid a,c-diamide adenosyltransferase [Kiritimatiellia bacterium]
MAKGRIYTKGGDGGDTSLLGGERVRKDSLRTETYGTVDELNSWLGVVATELVDGDLAGEMQAIQARLFEAGSRLACPAHQTEAYKLTWPGEAEVGELEAAIDRMLDVLPERKGFTLPGGSRAAAFTHVARTTCRRAERRLVALQAEVDDPDLRDIQIYLNRLSDYLYALARMCNHLDGVADIPWKR